MTVYEVLDQVIPRLQQRGQVTYRALKRQSELDDEYLEDLKYELIKALRIARDENGEVLVWVKDENGQETDSAPQSLPPSPPPPASNTPPHPRGPRGGHWF